MPGGVALVKVMLEQMACDGGDGELGVCEAVVEVEILDVLV